MSNIVKRHPFTSLVHRVPTSVRGFADAVIGTVPTTDDVPDDIGSIAGGVVAGYYGLKHGHPVLGAIGGMSAGRNLPLVFKPEQRRGALVNMAHTGAGVLGSLAAKKHPGWGFALAWVATGVAIHYFNLRGEDR